MSLWILIPLIVIGVPLALLILFFIAVGFMALCDDEIAEVIEKKLRRDK